jgi:hypothetical protein
VAIVGPEHDLHWIRPACSFRIVLFSSAVTASSAVFTVV